MRQNAGFIILKAEREPTNQLFEIVLGYKKTQYIEEWVTWECRGGYDYFWGHYFRNEREALEDYYSRLKKSI